MTASGDPRLYAPATARNREPILAVLRRTLPAEGLVLEISSGSGEHAIAFAAALPGLTWQPSDLDQQALASIAAHQAEAALANLRPPLALDAAAPDWPVARAAAIVCINMIHIAPWAACIGLLAGAGRVLQPDGVLYLYGPFMQAGRPTADSNLAFDRHLRHRNPAWGLRDLAAVTRQATTQGLQLIETIDMPANNLSVILRRGREIGSD